MCSRFSPIASFRFFPTFPQEFEDRPAESHVLRRPCLASGYQLACHDVCCVLNCFPTWVHGRVYPSYLVQPRLKGAPIGRDVGVSLLRASVPLVYLLCSPRYPELISDTSRRGYISFPHSRPHSCYFFALRSASSFHMIPLCSLTHPSFSSPALAAATTASSIHPFGRSNCKFRTLPIPAWLSVYTPSPIYHPIAIANIPASMTVAYL